jgi:hypothetical protein
MVEVESISRSCHWMDNSVFPNIIVWLLDNAQIQPPRRWGRRASNLTGPVPSLVSEVKKEDTLEVKLENKGNSSSSGEGSIINEAAHPRVDMEAAVVVKISFCHCLLQ